MSKNVLVRWADPDAEDERFTEFKRIAEVEETQTPDGVSQLRLTSSTADRPNITIDNDDVRWYGEDVDLDDIDTRPPV